MLLQPNDETLKALVLIGSSYARNDARRSFVPTGEIVDRLHLADADGVFDAGTAHEQAQRFMEDYA